MTRILIMLILIVPLFSNETQKESIDYSKYKWYVGIASAYSTPRAPTSINKYAYPSAQTVYFGNLKNKLEYSLSLDYGTENELEDIDIDYNFDPYYTTLQTREYLQDDQEGYAIGIGLKKYFYQNTYKNITTSLFSGLNLSTSIQRINHSYKYIGTTNNNTYQTIRHDELNSGRIFLGYNAEIFFKNNFSISFLSEVYIFYSQDTFRNQNATYDEDSILIYLSDDQNKSEIWNTSFTAFRWMLKYYFPTK